MDIAKSMGLGGKIVHANECNFSSYDDHKLRCYVCGEPVYLKKGEYRKPHFAHIHATSVKQVEECELRASSYGYKTEISSFTKDRGQRLKIFQQHFISMIYVGKEKIFEDVKFQNWIDSIKRDNNQAINNIIKDCSQYFLTHRRLIENKYILPSSKIKDKQIMLQQQIALEAIDYLCVKSSYKLLDYLLNYSIYKLYKYEKNSCFEPDILKNKIFTICCFAIKIVIINPWIEQFELIQNKQYSYQLYNQKYNKQKKINIKPGYIDGWSNTFTVQLTKGDYLASQLGYGLIILEAFHTNNTLTLFHKKNKILKKIIELATIEITFIPIYEWRATKFQYEPLADLLNKHGKIDTRTASNYIGLLLTDETLTIQDRVLCSKKTKGEKIVIKTYLNHDFFDKNNNVKDGCQWLDQIRVQLTAKMLQSNASTIAKKLNDLDSLKDYEYKVKQVKSSLKTLLRTIAIIKKFNPDMSDDELKELSPVISEYMICKLKLSRYDILGTLRELTPEKYSQLVIKSQAYYNNKHSNYLKETNTNNSFFFEKPYYQLRQMV